jgi:hypothetical protein
MDFIKQYIAQSISAASSNLRMNNQRIEVISMLKEVILKSDNVKNVINQMKKNTELSKLAIKLGEMHNYLCTGSIDYLKVTDKFKEHSFDLIKDLSRMLDLVNPYSFRQTVDKLIEPEKKVVEIIIESGNQPEDNYEESGSDQSLNIQSYDKPKLIAEEISVLDSFDESKTINQSKSFNSFESTILSPIKSLEAILNEMDIKSNIPNEVEEYSKLMNENANLASKNGFEILAQMHEIISQGLIHLKNKSLIPSKEVIESLRACLIVIVAVVKSKEVDISNYLNRAEVFGKFLHKINSEEYK